jgi:hypothetical protein
MTDVERASFLREGLAFHKEQNYGDTGRKRFWCAPRRKLLVACFLVPLIIGISLLLYLYAEPVFDRLPKFGIAPPADSETVRDFGIFLQPEAHTARRAKTQRLSWTITKSLLSPDGVEKQVFQINGTGLLSCIPMEIVHTDFAKGSFQVQLWRLALVMC